MDYKGYVKCLSLTGMRIGKYILTIAFLALSAGGFAQKFNYNGMRFRILTDSTVAVGNHHIPYDTLSYDTRPSEIPPQVGDIVIPTKVEYQGRHYAVTEIGDSAFMQCYDVTSVEIPEGITKIGSNAFAMTYDIKEFILPQSVRYIGEKAFMHADPKSIILPDTMDYIAKHGNIHTEVICHAQIPPENGDGLFSKYLPEGTMIPKSSALYAPKRV